MKKHVIGLMIFAVILGSFFAPARQAQADTLVASGDTFSYAYLSTDLYSDWNSAGYGSFDWNAAFWSTMTAPFSWPEGNDVALSKTITVDGIVTSATYYAGVDNGFILFVNGNQVAKANAEGGWGYWEYSGSINASYFHSGVNTIRVLLEDHGGATGFDMMIEADTSPVPVPASFLLFMPGLVGLAALRRKPRK